MRTPLVVLAAMLLLLPACAAHNKPLAAESRRAFGGGEVVTAQRAAAPAATGVATTLGTSRGGRPITAVTLGRGPTRTYLIGSIHGDEPEGRSALDDIRRALDASTGGTTVRFVQDMNPDGSIACSRTNSAGVDLNRNWPAANFKAAKDRGRAPLCEPESAAVHADILRFDPHVIVVLHSARNGPFVNYDGPDAAKSLSTRFVAAAKASGDSRWRIVPDMGYPTPGSMGSYFGDDRGVPILTVELRRGDNETKVPAPLVAGLNAVLADRSVAVVPMSRSHAAIAAKAPANRRTTSAEPAR